MIEATDKSISPEMINSAIAKPIIAFSVTLKLASERFQGSRKYGEARLLNTNTSAATISSSVSQRSNSRCSFPCSLSGTWCVASLDACTVLDVGAPFVMWTVLPFSESPVRPCALIDYSAQPRR